MNSCVVKKIKKLDQNYSVILDSLTLDTYELVPDSDVKHITIKNCTIRRGLKISGVSRGASLIIEDCIFESYNGIKIEKSSFRAIYIKNSVLQKTAIEDMRLDILSRIISQTVQILDSYIHNLFINNINISLEVKNSIFESKLDYFPAERTDDERSWAYFEDVTFKSTRVRMAGAELEDIQFKNINTNLEALNRCNVLEINQDFVLKLIFENAMFKDTYIDLSNTAIRNIEANNSDLGKCFDFFSGNLIDEDQQKVNYLAIKNCYMGISYFHGRRFHNSLDFSNSQFQNPPEFYNSEIPHGSIFPSSQNFYVSGSDRSIAAFRALRLQMEEQRNRELEGEFFYLEQKSILNNKSKSGNWLRYAYGLISDFGNNAVKPLAILLATMLCFTLFYALIMSPEVSVSLPIDYELLSKSMHFSTKQMTLPFWSVRNLTPLLDKEVQTHPIMYLAIIQSIVSLICIALSALAIRWRFKRG